MRMIDADALIAQMEADAEQMDEPIAQMFVYAAINDIKHAPTIERKTGKWIDTGEAIDDDTEVKCSECGEVLYWLSNYCPNCGADMRGEGHE